MFKKGNILRTKLGIFEGSFLSDIERHSFLVIVSKRIRYRWWKFWTVDCYKCSLMKGCGEVTVFVKPENIHNYYGKM